MRQRTFSSAMRLFHHLRRERERFLRAQLASVAATVADWLLLTGLVAAGVHYLAAAAAGALAGAALDFRLKKAWVFRSPGALALQAPRYVAVSFASAALNALAAWLLVERAGLPKVPAVIAASMIVAVGWNYPLQRWFVFGRGEKSAAGAAR